MANGSRVGNAVKNVSVATAVQIFTLVLSFVSRTVFVRLLGNDYLSCDGLFTNILTILSFSELGIGSAIIYSLYKPIAEGDQQQIGKLMNLFATAYRIIALAISFMGICIIPFLKYLVTDVPDISESITLLYVLFLANTVASYVFGYKRSFLIANQENYIVLIVQQGIHVLRIILQIILLLITHNYIVYLAIAIFCTLLTNIVSTLIVDKKYPWINQYKKDKLTKDERKPIFSNIESIVVYKFGSVILNGTDNILISLCLKTAYVGLCSNYNMIINAITGIVNQACNGLQATIGNFNVEKSERDRYQVFRELYFISFWIFGFCAVCLITLLNPFIQDVWLGNEYTLSFDVVLALVITFYISMINMMPSTFRTTMGYFKEARTCPLIAAVMNVILTIVLANCIGLSGVFFATAISRILTFNIIDPYFVFKKGFGISPIQYLKTFLLYTGILLLDGGLTYGLVYVIPIDGILGFIVKFFVCIIVSNVIFLLIFCKTKLFKDAVAILKNYIKHRR